MVVETKRVDEFKTQGYTIVPQLFSKEEVATYIDHYMTLRGKGTYPGDFPGVNVNDADPLKKYPRMIHMHRWDELSLKWMIDPRLNAYMTAFGGGSPLAVQTMLYFKPPGARGQALHQDNYYLQVKPGTCLAAWLALDDCDEATGCLQVVPGTHDTPELCPQAADTSQSFTDVTVPLAEGMRSVPMLMKAGDVLFFNGQLVHGSFPNTTKDRFRRSLIGHYIVAEAQKVAEFYHPVLRMDGSEVRVEQNGEQVVEMVRPARKVQTPLHE
jgi:phytanoyl-CoA hydroxylase